MSTAKNKIEQAIARGWTRRLPPWCGPCTFNRMSRRERASALRALQAAQVDNRWRPVAEPVAESAP